MSSFINILDMWNSFNCRDYMGSVTTKEVKETLGHERISELDLLRLLSPAADNLLEDIAEKSQRVTIQEFGKTVQIYTPLYLSNYCKNRCIYCGFNSDIDIPRIKLTDSQIISEGIKISKLGIRHILLLTGGDRVNSPVSYIKHAVTLLKTFFDSISIEVYALNEDEYRDIIMAGVDNVTIYQETYNKNIYSQVHISGEKKSYSFRLGAPERAAKAGINSVNLGALLGLYDPIIDFFNTAIHCRYIEEHYPGCGVSISFPRIKESNGSFKPTETVTDRLLAKFIMVFRLFMPKGSISISTRESEDLRDNLLPLGVNKMSIASKTSVGGHSGLKSEKQFEISDTRTVLVLDERLREKGYQPIYKDWILE